MHKPFFVAFGLHLGYWTLDLFDIGALRASVATVHSVHIDMASDCCSIRLVSVRRVVSGRKSVHSSHLRRSPALARLKHRLPLVVW